MERKPSEADLRALQTIEELAAFISVHGHRPSGKSPDKGEAALYYRVRNLLRG